MPDLEMTPRAETPVTRSYVDGVVRSIRDALIVTDPAGLVTSLNPAAAFALGCAEREVVGLAAETLFERRGGAPADAGVSALLRSEGLFKDLEMNLLARDGTRIPVLVSSSVLRDADGSQIGMVVVAKDISERLAVEAALRESEERTRLLLDAAPEGIYGIDLKGNCNMANASCLRLLGYKDVCEIMGRNMHVVAHHSRADGAIYPVRQCRIFQAFWGGRGTHVDDEVFWRADGTSFPVEFWSHPIWRDGKTTGAVVSFVDVSERKRLQKLVQQAEKLSAIGQLAAGVAHEINNPLGVILGFSQSALRKVQESDPLSFPLKSIEREALRCKLLVQNLLAFSRQSKPNMDEFDVNDALSGTLSIMEAQAHVKAVEIVKELGDAGRMYGDRNQLQQIVVNLCGNAIDAMPQGGRVIVRTRRAPSVDGPRVIVDFEDNGTGIPPEIQAKIFDPFFTTKEVGKGTGLGLSLVCEIVHKHRGTIELKSQVGQGATFTLSFPAERPKE